MKLKQKILMVVAIFGLVLSSSVVLSSRTASAEEMIPSACVTDPDSDRCKHCKDGILAEAADGCSLVSASDNSAEDEAKCEDLKTSILNVDSLCKDEDGPIFGLLKWVLRIMTAGVGVAAVGGIAWGALLYTTAENKPEQTKKAISIITNVVIGIVAYALMAVFLNFLIPGGIIG